MRSDPSAVMLAVISVLLVLFALVAFWMWLTQRRPLTPTDRHCAQVDEDIDRARDARRRVLAGGGFRVEYRTEAPSLSVIGDVADRVWRDRAADVGGRAR